MPSLLSTRHASRPPRRSPWLVALLVLLLIVLSVIGTALIALRATPGEAWRTLRSRPTMEMVRYAEFRLIGHPALESLLLPLLNVVRHQLEREPSSLLADFGKGQQTQSLPPPVFDSMGLPRAIALTGGAPPPVAATRTLSSVDAIRSALGEARPGDVLEITPGRYMIDDTLVTGRAGEPGRPITLRARRPGTVQLQVGTTQGFIVNQPHWVFENLDLIGACKLAEDCESALHVVGGAIGTLIRNNLISEFNAPIKINGEDGRWPDSGLAQFNSLVNSAPRNTRRPVVMVDLVAADRWQLADNLVKGFIKRDGNGIAYGLYMKGSGSNGRIERNLVVCTPQGISQPGLRVGISIGGGATDPRACRDGQCAAEHYDAVVINNVVAHCNDVGIDVNHSQRTLVAYNTLVNTLGVLVREQPSDATVQGNLLEGSIRIRNGGVIRQDHNLIASRMGDVLLAPDALDLRWRELPAMLPVHPMVADDFCGQARPRANPPGATLSARCPLAEVPAKP